MTLKYGDLLIKLIKLRNTENYDQSRMYASNEVFALYRKLDQLVVDELNNMPEGPYKRITWSMWENNNDHK